MQILSNSLFSSSLSKLSFVVTTGFLSASTFAAPVSFVRDLAPILADKCLTCHQEGKAKGKYRVDTFAELLKAGSSDEAPFVIGKPDESFFFHLLVTHEEDDRMPQKDDPLPSAQIDLFKRWIAEGVKFDGADPKLSLANLAPAKGSATAQEKYTQPIPITALAWMKDHKTLVSSGYHEVLLWDTDTGKLVKRIGGLPERILAMSLHANGKTLAVSGGIPGRAGETTIVDLETGKVIKTLPSSQDTTLAVTFSKDGSRLAQAGTDNTVRLFQTSDWKLLWKAEAHADWVLSLAFSPDGKQLLSTSRDRTARLYNVADGEAGKTFTSHSNPVTTAVFSVDNKTIVTASNDGQVRRWTTDGSVPEKMLPQARQEVTRLSLFQSSLISTSADGRVRFYDLSKDGPATMIEAFGKRINAVAINENGTRFALGGNGGKVQIGELPDRKKTQLFTAAPGW